MNSLNENCSAVILQQVNQRTWRPWPIYDFHVEFTGINFMQRMAILVVDYLRSWQGSQSHSIWTKLQDTQLIIPYDEGDDQVACHNAKALKDEEKGSSSQGSNVLQASHRLGNFRYQRVLDQNLFSQNSMERDYEPSLSKVREGKLRSHPKCHFPMPFMDQMLERLAGNEYYCFLDGFSGYFQIPIDPKDQEKKPLLAHTVLSLCRMPFGLCNAPGKSHFMVKEGIVLGHKISKSGLEVDRAKFEVITKLPHPTSVKGVRSFLGHAGFYRRFIQDFSKIVRPMTHLLEKETPFFFSEECIDSFNTLKRKLTEAPILIAPEWDLPFELMCDASDFAIGAFLGQRKNKHFQPIHYASNTMNDDSTPWFADFANYHAGKFVIKGMTSQ
ncbi:DNA-directed DNA polymerase, partial [Tanacetum coccineum]